MLERLTWGSGQIARPGFFACDRGFGVRKIAVAAVGFTVLAAGVALLVLPGPAIVVIPLGLGILAREFIWAQKLLGEIKQLLRRLKAGASQALANASAGGFFSGRPTPKPTI